MYWYHQINNETNKKNLVKNNNTPFSERKTFNDIISYFLPNNNINSNSNNNSNNIKYNLHFLLIIKNDVSSSEQIGLNFRFNYLKDVSKISFNKNAPEIVNVEIVLIYLHFVLTKNVYYIKNIL